MAKMVGMNVVIKQGWTKKAVALLGENLAEGQYKAALNEHLSFEIDSAINLRKAREILMRVWYRDTDGVGALQAEGRALAQKYPDRLTPINWCMTALVFPAFADIAKLMGKMFGFQDVITTTQIKQKMFDEWGETGTLQTVVAKIVGTMREIGGITSEKTGRQEAASIPVNNEDIISFRESNNLSSRGDLKMLSHPMKEAMSMQMLAMYRILAYTTDDVTVWDSFFNEPLIRYCLDYKEFRDTVLHELGENPSHLEAVKKLMSEHEEVPSSSFITVKEKGFTYSLEKRKKGLIIMILAWLAQLIFSLFLAALLIDVPLVGTIIGALIVVGFLAITVYTIVMFSNQ